MSRPGGHTTGFIQLEYGLAGKWLELLKEIAPRIARVGVLREPGPAGIGQWAIIQAVAQTMGVELKAITLASAGEIERAVSGFARRRIALFSIVAAEHALQLLGNVSLAAKAKEMNDRLYASVLSRAEP